MADPYISEIRMFAGNYAPRNWALCQGQLMAISQNTALFSLLGTNFGGDGRVTFGLPNLQGRAPMMAGNGPGLTPRTIGEVGGEPSVTLITGEMAQHNHAALGTSDAGTTPDPTGAVWAVAGVARGTNMYSSTPGSSPVMNPQALTPGGGSQPHNNMPPYIAISFIICLAGIFPSRP